MTDWPWPMEGVQDWFENLWNWISDAARDAGSWLWDQINEAFRSVTDWVTSRVEWLRDEVSSKVTWIGASIVANAEWIRNQIIAHVGSFDVDVGKWLGGLGESVQTYLSPISNALNDLLGSIQDAASDAAGWLRDSIFGWIDGLARWLTDSFKWVADHVEENAAWTVNAIRNSLGDIGKAISEGVGEALEGAGKTITDGFKVFGEWLYAGLKDIWEAIQGGITWFMENVTGFFEGVISQVSSTIRNAIKPGSPPPETMKEMNQLAESWTGMVQEKLKEAAKSPIDIKMSLKVATGIAGVGLGAAAVGVAVGVAADAAHPAKEFGGRDVAKLVLAYLGVDTTIKPLVTVPYDRGVLEPLRQYFNTVYEATIPDTGGIISMRTSLTIDDPQYIGLMSRQGLESSLATAWLTASYTIAGPAELFQMTWREKITPAQLEGWLAKSGLHPDLVGPMASLRDLIPGIGDLIRFVVREVITPDEFNTWMARQGVSLFWTEKHWTAHFVLPAFAQLVDAYHRGIINEEELEKFIFWHDYMPDPRPGIGKSDLTIMRGLLKTLIPRVDLRRGWELGELTDEDLDQRYETLGYEEDAPLMARIQKRVALQAEITKLLDNAKKDHVAGFNTEEQLRLTISDLGYGPAIVDIHVADAVEDRERSFKKRMLDLWEDQYMKDLITDEQLRDYVTDMVLDPDSLQVFLEETYLKKYKAPKPPTPPKVKVLPLSTLARAYREGITDSEELRGEMLRRKYPEAQVDIYMALQDKALQEALAAMQLKKAKAEKVDVKRISVAQLGAAFREALIDEALYREDLVARNYLETDIELMVSRQLKRIQEELAAMAEKKARAEAVDVKRISDAQLGLAFRVELITEVEYREELLARHYPAADVDLMVRLQKERMAAA